MTRQVGPAIVGSAEQSVRLFWYSKCCRSTLRQDFFAADIGTRQQNSSVPESRWDVQRASFPHYPSPRTLLQNGVDRAIEVICAGNPGATDRPNNFPITHKLQPFPKVKNSGQSMSSHECHPRLINIEAGAALMSGRPIKSHFDARRNPGRLGNVPTLKIPPGVGMTGITGFQQS